MQNTNTNTSPVSVARVAVEIHGREAVDRFLRGYFYTARGPGYDVYAEPCQGGRTLYVCEGSDEDVGDWALVWEEGPTPSEFTLL